MNLKQTLRLFIMWVAVIFIFTLNQSAAQAQQGELLVDGSTKGTFSSGTNTLGGLSFSGTPFGGTTSGGVLVLNDMGTLTLTPGTGGGTQGSFTFQAAFGRPDGVNGGTPVTVTGTVDSSGPDSAFIFFNETSPVVSFSGANGAGVFSFAFHDICLVSGEQIDCNQISKLEGRKLLKALALNTAQSGDGNVKFVKAKGSSSMLAPSQTFTITATITLLLPGNPLIPPGLIPPGSEDTFTFPRKGPPTSKDECKNGGWEMLNNPNFKNQGECVSFVNHK